MTAAADRNAYMREYRKRPAVRESELARARAQLQAWKALAVEYPDRYAALYAEALSVQQAAVRGAAARQGSPGVGERR